MAVIWGERQIPDCLRMDREALERLARIRVADEDGAVASARPRMRRPLGEIAHAPDGGGDTGRIAGFLDRFRFREAQGVVFAAGEGM